MKRTSRPTGPDRRTRALMYDRDGDRCCACNEVGLRDRDLIPNHRVNRGMGGSTAPWINDLTNLVTACRGCNNRFEDDPAYSYAMGWKVRYGVNPATVPVCYGDGSWWLLDLDGSRRPTAAPRAA